jgi:hypothetical protein
VSMKVLHIIHSYTIHHAPLHPYTLLIVCP